MKSFIALLSACIGTALLVNLFVGLLLYGNPLVPLADIENMVAVVYSGTLLALAILLLHKVVRVLEKTLQ